MKTHRRYRPTLEALEDRLVPSGGLDTTFNGTGYELVDVNHGAYDHLEALAVQGNGDIIAAGHTNGGQAFTLVRLNPDGTLDNSFGNGGKRCR